MPRDAPHRRQPDGQSSTARREQDKVLQDIENARKGGCFSQKYVCVWGGEHGLPVYEGIRLHIHSFLCHGPVLG